MELLDALFGTKNNVDGLQEMARAIVIFFYGWALVRAAGRRVFGKWSALDIIVSIIIGSNLSRALTGSAAFGGTLLATTLIMAVHWLLTHAAARSPRLSQILEGVAIPLATAGRTDRSALLQHAISGADIDESLHQAGVDSMAETRLVSLEPSGKITVLKER